MKRKVTIWVSEETRARLKIEAAKRGITVMALLEGLSSAMTEITTDRERRRNEL